MGNRTKFKVEGTSKTKPTNLPAGLKVEEVKVPIDETFSLLVDRKLKVSDSSFGGLHFKMSATGTYGENSVVQSHMNKEELKRLRDLLNEFFESELRTFQDRDGSNTRLWYEVDADKFVFSKSRGDAEVSFARYPQEAWRFEKLNSTYGPLTAVKE